MRQLLLLYYDQVCSMRRGILVLPKMVHDNQMENLPIIGLDRKRAGFSTSVDENLVFIVHRNAHFRKQDVDAFLGAEDCE